LIDRAPSPAIITVDLTGQGGVILNVDGWPQTQHADKNSPSMFDIPPVVLDKNSNFVDVTDYRQTIQILGGANGNALQSQANTGPISDLSLEAVYQDPTTHQYSLDNTTDSIAEIRGIDVTVTIPDLFADTKFTFDSSTGYSGTPYTGEGMVNGLHIPTATPEPSSLFFLASGTLTTCGYAWCRRKRTRGHSATMAS
jgi:hypothetical protein